MTNEPAFNIMKTLDYRINKRNYFYQNRKSIKKENQVQTGESYLNYLYSNDYAKPFIPNKYNFKYDYKKSFTNKLNIYNYKSNKEKSKILKTKENELMKRMLNILSKHNEENMAHLKRTKHNYRTFKNIDTNYFVDSNSHRNKTLNSPHIHALSQEQTHNILPKLPKINNKKDNDANKDSLENDTFRSTSNNKNYIDDTFMKYKRLTTPKNYLNKNYSPILGKSMAPIYKIFEDKASLSVKKGDYIRSGIREMNRKKYHRVKVKIYHDLKRIEKDYKQGDGKYCLINLFSNIGRVRDTKQIEKALFNSQENTYSTLKSNIQKKGIKRIKKCYELSVESES
jgi:hypothetical protein